MRHAEEGRRAPAFPCQAEEPPPFRAAHAAESLVEEDECGRCAPEAARNAYLLPFPSGNRPPFLSEQCVGARGKGIRQLAGTRLLERAAKGVRLGSVQHVLEKRAVPESYAGVDPRRPLAKRVRGRGVEARAIHFH